MSKKGFVSCNLKGGLGNQLFQIFATIAYGLRTNREIRFNFTETIGNRSAYWHSFFKGLEFTRINSNDFMYLFHQSSVFHQEPSYAYSDIPEYPEVGNVLLDGYYQSRNYFKGYEKEILEMFGEKRGYLGRKGGHGIVSPKIGMHFRIGDYKHIQHCHPLMPTSYYVNALTECLKDHDSDLRLWKGTVERLGGVIDDVMEVIYLCEESDVLDVEKHLVVLRESFPDLRFRRGLSEMEKGDRECDRDWKEMALLSQCDWFIIPNSSFSWWAATFSSMMDLFETEGEKGEKVVRGEKWVYYPSVWFGPALAPSHNIRDMLNQTGWKQI